LNRRIQLIRQSSVLNAAILLMMATSYSKQARIKWQI
jgi:hypothetical protein